MKIKIAFYIESMVVGGAEKVLIDLVNNLDATLFDITVIAIFKKSVYNDYEFQFEQSFASHIHYHWLVDNSNPLKYKAFNFLYNRLPKSWLYRALNKEKYDIEVAFYEGMPTDFVTHSIQNSKKTAWLHTHQERLYQNLSAVQKQELYNSYKKFDAIAGVSKAVCDSFTNIFYDLIPVTLYNPIDDKLIKDKAALPVDVSLTHFLSANYWVTVGRLIPIKGYDRLIRVLGKLKKEGYDFKLLMIGAGYKEQEYKSLIKENHLETNITLLGHIDNPYPFIKNATALIMSSIQEGLSTVVIESLILNTKVFTTECSGMTELIDNGISGLICHNSEDGIYRLLKEVLDKSPISDQCKANFQFSEFQFSLHSSIKAIENLFETI